MLITLFILQMMCLGLLTVFVLETLSEKLISNRFCFMWSKETQIQSCKWAQTCGVKFTREHFSCLKFYSCWMMETRPCFRVPGWCVWFLCSSSSAWSAAAVNPQRERIGFITKNLWVNSSTMMTKTLTTTTKLFWDEMKLKPSTSFLLRRANADSG